MPLILKDNTSFTLAYILPFFGLCKGVHLESSPPLSSRRFAASVVGLSLFPSSIIVFAFLHHCYLLGLDDPQNPRRHAIIKIHTWLFGDALNVPKFSEETMCGPFQVLMMFPRLKIG